ncbi:fibronectin type III domain-containing protein [Blautia luti]|uniref:fibronectin type III domain-containing protein n=1 Tax=Blautia luti TaxID=89014 RepID=UPI0018A97681|nr:fibronectin type III domain-containing protein [Blautia luti]
MSEFSDGSEYTTNLGAQVRITDFGLQKGTTRTVYVKWSWSQLHTKEYRVVWYYLTGQGTAFIGDDSRTTKRQATYNAPSNAVSVKVKVLPIAESRKIDKDHTADYWMAKWSTLKQYNFKNNPPSDPSTPTVTIAKYKLTAALTNISTDTDKIEWYIVKDDKTKYYSVKTKVNKRAASITHTVASGGRYKVRCRAWRGSQPSGWSDYSENVMTVPSSVGKITKIKAFSETGITIDWDSVKNCISYEIQYTTDKRYFDSNPNEVHSQTVESVSHAEVTGLEIGNTYFFRVRAVNAQGNSGWSPIKSIILGKEPSAPTTWSTTTTAIIGEELVLYWVHNSVDGSSEKKAELELTINGVTTKEEIVNKELDDKVDDTKSKTINTSKWNEGSTIKWRVRTMGITGKYGSWSVQRVINVYAPPTLELTLYNAAFEQITSSELGGFPFYIGMMPGPKSQGILGYHISIIALESYSTVDETGVGTVISKGQEVFSKYYDGSVEAVIGFSAGDVNLENNIHYRIVCSATMSSGLSAESSEEITISWKETSYSLNAEVAYNADTYSFLIRPYCLNEYEDLTDKVTLAVYRRQYDGEFIEIASRLENSSSCFVTDPHPALDFARYRIVATNTSTGAVDYYDLPGYPINEPGIIIQWEEQWENLITSEINENDSPAEPEWSGSMVRLLYNVDIADDNDKDVSLVEYIGRKHPVSYYGTQLGHTSTWKTDIPAYDTETLYALRRLAIYQGDVYVRESTGSGYWANVSVAISKTHCNGIIPVTLKVTHVEGGV